VTSCEPAVFLLCQRVSWLRHRSGPDTGGWDRRHRGCRSRLERRGRLSV